MNNIKKMIQDIDLDIEQVVEEFYQQKTQDAYQHLNGTIEKMLVLVDKIAMIQKEQIENAIDGGDLLNALKETVSAMEEKDFILVADVLKYEVQEKLKDLMEIVRE